MQFTIFLNIYQKYHTTTKKHLKFVELKLDVFFFN